MKNPLHSRRGGLVVGTLAAGGALALLASLGPASVLPTLAAGDDDPPGDISGPCDEAEHANDARCVDTTVQPQPQEQTTRPASSPSDVRVVDASNAGTVTYRLANGSLTLIDAEPSDGWSVEVEQSSGRELEVDFRSGTRRVQVNVELEDGRPRERVRLRDEATDNEIRIEDGTVVRTELDDDRDDLDGHGDDNSGPGSDDAGHDDLDDHRDDNSGPGSDSSGHDGDDDDDRDDDNSGPGSDDSGHDDDDDHDEDDDD